MCRRYAKGLSWVLQYYFHGVPAWDWFYPYHYAPFASDFKGALAELTNEFPVDTKPFSPFEQLMSVFPAASGQFLPPAWRRLMDDPKSPIIDFYPTEFGLDLNGKRFDWQAVVLLPFVDEVRLFKALDTVRETLTPAEKLRNSLGEELLYVSSLLNGDIITSFLLTIKCEETVIWHKLPTFQPNEDFNSTDRRKQFVISGTVRCSQYAQPMDGRLASPYGDRLSEITNTTALCVEFRNPKYPPGFKFKSNLLPGVRMPDITIKPANCDDNMSYRPVTAFNYRAQFGRGVDQPLNRAINASLSLSHRPPPSVNQWVPTNFASFSANMQIPYNHNEQAFPPAHNFYSQPYHQNVCPVYDNVPYQRFAAPYHDNNRGSHQGSGQNPQNYQHSHRYTYDDPRNNSQHYRYDNRRHYQ